MRHITEGNEAFINQRYHEALRHYEIAAKQIDGQLLSYNIYKCKQELAKHPAVFAPSWTYAYYDSEILNKKITDKKYIAGIATMPSRVATLEKVINSILPQVDEIHIFLNNFITVPPFLYHAKINIHRSQEHGDQRDNGKFFGLKFVSNDCYYFTLDDDIRYPRGYFNVLANKIISHENKVAVGVHGVIYASKPKSFFDRLTFNFERELAQDVPVSVLGTGTTGFYTGTIKPPFEFFTRTGMADLILGAYLKKVKLPAICIARPKSWLAEYHRDDRSDTIYSETKASSNPYDSFLIENSPWGAKLINDVVRNLDLTLSHETISFLEFIQDLPTIGISNKHINNGHTQFFACAGVYPYSDRAYIHQVKNLISSILLAPNSRPPLGVALAQALLEDNTVGAISPISSSDDVLAYNQALITAYADDCSNPELDVLIKALDVLQTSNNNQKQIAALLNSALRTGQSNVLVPVVPDNILRSLDAELIFALLKAAISERSDCQEKLLLCLSDFDQANHTLVFLKAMYETARNSATCEKATLNVLKGKYKSRNKARHLAEVMRLALECGTPILPKSKYDILLDESIDVPVKRVLLDALMTEGQLKHQKPVELLIKSLHQYDLDNIELKLRTAELKRQVKPNTQNVLTIINECFREHGMMAITRPTKGTSFFNDLKPSGKKALSENFGLCTVIIAAYNAEKTLQYAYDSICNQTYPNIEVIIVDDCNQVPVESYLKVNKKISTKLVRNDVNQGPYGCRNVAIKLMTGAFFVIHDADDWAHPEKLSIQIESIQGSDKVCSYARHIRVTSDGALKLENHGNFIGHGPMTSLFKSKILAQIGDFDAVATRGDMEYKARIKRFYGEQAIHEDPRLMLLSLDWHSNSKQKTSSLHKAFKLSHYKNSYTKWHTLMPFMHAI
ncbi:glycosyltransferase family A protein [Pseudomonas putida]|uniref:glycosyltransferase family A protein n=1 Tax=Pseudomonas putida TaxID=303 RepID=UPI0018D76EA7|nr:glycosyltransferase family A protein [Pseudomonas putida]MBH3415865.1 glycosyltransferase family 2 protein [Pseudomonas putida]MDG9814549.1 glycosyltransferase family 2 protein [Pseudomonas putida]